MNPLSPYNARISQVYDAYSIVYPQWGFRHKGIDYAAISGMPVYALERGKVVFSGKRGGWGNLVVLRGLDTGVYSWHAHLLQTNVESGDTIKRGDFIGKVGTTGFSTGNHLHYGTTRNSTMSVPTSEWFNPEDYYALLTKTILMNFNNNTSFKKMYVTTGELKHTIWICRGIKTTTGAVSWRRWKIESKAIMPSKPEQWQKNSAYLAVIEAQREYEAVGTEFLTTEYPDVITDLSELYTKKGEEVVTKD